MNNTIQRKSLCFMLIMVMLIPSFAFANGNTGDDKILNDLDSIGKDYGISFGELPNEYNGEILEFDTVEEFQAFLEDMAKEQKKLGIDHKNNTIDIEMNTIPLSFSDKIEESSFVQSVAKTSSKEKIYEDSYHWKKYTPYTSFMITGMFCTKHIYFDYDYYYDDGKAKFKRVYNIKSDATGMNLASWKEVKVDKVKYSSKKDKATIKVHGKWVLGVNINGHTYGATDPQTWTMSLKLNSK
ncbi:hypothetical protein [Wukongibacter sp. M2B1]|uniref:hypothetical protein n=1 Tax=Wukongibacter sp. M2B1 TaxID=3088895 RepID=UPI003D7B68C4